MWAFSDVSGQRHGRHFGVSAAGNSFKTGTVHRRDEKNLIPGTRSGCVPYTIGSRAKSETGTFSSFFNFAGAYGSLCCGWGGSSWLHEPITNKRRKESKGPREALGVWFGIVGMH